MQEILHRSLLEMEILHRQAEMEQVPNTFLIDIIIKWKMFSFRETDFLFWLKADLEQAVALSLTLEEERLRLQLLAEKKSSPCQQRLSVEGDKDYDMKVLFLKSCLSNIH